MPFVKINGININYSIEGQGDPLILIIGLGSDQSNWRLQTGFFKKNYQVITFDNRGAGKSDKPLGPYSIKMMADDTIGLMNYLHIMKAHIMGVSMGGMIAQEIAINYPERVKKLILGCTFCENKGVSGFSVEVSNAIEEYKKTLPGVDRIRKVVTTIIDLSFNTNIFRIVTLPLMKSAIKFSSLKGVAEQLEAILAHDTRDRLKMVESPTLVLMGTNDKVIKPTSSEVIANLIKNSKLVKIVGGSHGFSGEMSNEFNKIVLEFLKSNEI